MYVTAEIIREVEQKFGVAEEISLTYEMTEREFDMVRRSQKNQRAHDVTMFILRADYVVVIKKPMYPPGAYRAPSGGINPSEPFEEGALREAYEETGLTVALDRYLLRVRVDFTCEGRLIQWTSHVFTASILDGLLQPVDTHEIVEARFASFAELRGSIRKAMLDSGSTGLRYRAELNDLVLTKIAPSHESAR
jgi:8-oxo-dGTP pyrophosphatase MutT (NUDIX family)